MADGKHFGPRTTKLFPLLRGVTFLVLLLALIITVRSISFQEEMNGVLVSMLEPELLGDRLIGTQVPSKLDVRDLAPGQRSPSYSLYWYLDLRRCVDCTYDLHHWNSLAGDGSIDVVVILPDPPVEASTGFLEQLHPNVIVNEIATPTAEELFGYSFASLRFLSDASGEILNVNSTLPNYLCLWSYPAYIARVLGMEERLPLRLSASSASGVHTNDPVGFLPIDTGGSRP
jgi:hypothetical protein